MGINAGTLALGATGSISNAPTISLSAGAVFDVSAIAGGRVLNAGNGGAGGVNGSVIAASNSTITAGIDLNVQYSGD